MNAMLPCRAWWVPAGQRNPLRCQDEMGLPQSKERLGIAANL